MKMKMKGTLLIEYSDRNGVKKNHESVKRVQTGKILIHEQAEVR